MSLLVVYEQNVTIFMSDIVPENGIAGPSRKWSYSMNVQSDDYMR